MSEPGVVSLIDDKTKIIASSTLDKSFSKKYLTDGNPETCWSSQQGLPQYVHIKFNCPVIPKTIHITFQGGFVGKTCSLCTLVPSPSIAEANDNDGNINTNQKSVTQKTLKTLSHIYPEDVNRKQTFSLPDFPPIEEMRIVFEESSDFFGRVTVYDLQIEGLLLS